MTVLDFNDCRSCPENQYAQGTGLDTVCTPCFDNQRAKQGAMSYLDCKCIAGFFRASPTDLFCTTCSENSYCPGSDAIYACGDRKVAPAGSVSVLACQCLKGFTVTADGACDGCALGEFIDFSRGVCSKCPADYYCPDGIYLYGCPEFSFSMPGATTLSGNGEHACTCSNGYVPDMASGEFACRPCNVDDDCEEAEVEAAIDIAFGNNVFDEYSPEQLEYLAQESWAQMQGDDADTQVVPKQEYFSSLDGEFELSTGTVARRRSLLSADADAITLDAVQAMKNSVIQNLGSDVSVDKFPMSLRFRARFLFAEFAGREVCIQTWNALKLSEVRRAAAEYLRTSAIAVPCVCIQNDNTCNHFSVDCLYVNTTIAELPDQPNDFMVTSSFSIEKFIRLSGRGWRDEHNSWLQTAVRTIDIATFCEASQSVPLNLVNGRITECVDSVTGVCSDAALGALLNYDIAKIPSCSSVDGIGTMCYVSPPATSSRRLLQNAESCFLLGFDIDGTKTYFVFQKAQVPNQNQVEYLVHNASVELQQACALPSSGKCQCEPPSEETYETADYYTQTYALNVTVQRGTADNVDFDLTFKAQLSTENIGQMADAATSSLWSSLVEAQLVENSDISVEARNVLTGQTGFRFKVDSNNPQDFATLLNKVEQNSEDVKNFLGDFGFDAVVEQIDVMVSSKKCPENQRLNGTDCICDMYSKKIEVVGLEFGCQRCEDGKYKFDDFTCVLCPVDHYCLRKLAEEAKSKCPDKTDANGKIIHQRSIAGSTLNADCMPADQDLLVFELDTGRATTIAASKSAFDPVESPRYTIETAFANVSTGLSEIAVIDYVTTWHIQWADYADNTSLAQNLTQKKVAAKLNAVTNTIKVERKCEADITKCDVNITTTILYKDQLQLDALKELLSTMDELSVTFARSFVTMKSKIVNFDETVNLFGQTLQLALQPTMEAIFGGSNANKIKCFDIKRSKQDQVSCAFELNEVVMRGQCLCPAHHVREHSVCQPCPDGQYRSLNLDSCVPCKEGFSCRSG
jgi:hypothetical protein